MLALMLDFLNAQYPWSPQAIANLLWVIVALPLVGAFLCGVLGKFMGRANTNFLACATVAGSFLLSAIAVFAVGTRSTEFVSPASGTPVYWALWLDLGRWFAAGDFSAHYGFMVDRLSGALLLVITGIGFLIHLYSTEYMEHDEGYWRYFAYLNLFVAMMLTLVMADNLVLLFVGWEGVGLCSYLLIGFWYQDTEKAFAGRKAFITNRIGDFAFIIGMIFLILMLQATEAMGRSGPGRGNFTDIGPARAWVSAMHEQGPLNVEVLRGWAARIPPDLGEKTRGVMTLETPITEGSLKGKTYGHVLTAALLLMLLGAAGKSAQIPLYVWLPDAMAGPTPVSALIHAATMVTAGVYLFCRLSFLLVLSPTAMAWVAMIGALTAVWAALIAFAQDDIKKVLAYSTVSQLGFMFMGVGMGVFWAAALHLITHACFKACLFLGAGSVMHGNADETDIKRLGGLRKEMPWTWATFGIATLAITGIVPLSGFFSKDAILHGAHTLELEGFPHLGHLVYGMGLFGALCTAFYMTRLYLLTFEGKRAADARVPHAHESGFRMVSVLVVLAALSVLGVAWGWPGTVPGPGGERVALLEGYFAPATQLADGLASRYGLVKHEHSSLLPGYLVAWAVALIGGAGAWFVYRRWLPSRAGQPLPAFISVPWRWARHKFYVDEVYNFLVIWPFAALSSVLYKVVDAGLIDGVAVGGTAGALRRVGGWLRYTQTGNAQNYATVMAVGLLVSIGVVLTWVLR
ncbi:MAG TPA: proton-conducting transporter membrane subunit [Myxococcaceae bacterium]|nr:proton-conducting transporter membrane subunit [Myxococcaceae bacterium]